MSGSQTEQESKHTPLDEAVIRGDVNRWTAPILIRREPEPEALLKACKYLTELLAELRRTRRLLDEHERCRSAFAPVSEWYTNTGDLPAQIAAAVADLQEDRRESLRVGRLLEAGERLARAAANVADWRNDEAINDDYANMGASDRNALIELDSALNAYEEAAKPTPLETKGDADG